jgi:hypothetical protein
MRLLLVLLILVIALVVAAVVAVATTMGRLKRHASPSHCYGRARSTLVSERERAKGRPIRTVCDWLKSYLTYRLTPKHKVVALDARAGDGIDELLTGADGSTCLAITGDWADGSPNSEAVAAEIRRVAPDYTTHLGDIYSVGAQHEIERKFAAGPRAEVIWPLGTFGGLAVPGNHEYHSGAHAFNNIAMGQHLGLRDRSDSPIRHQPATYFCLRNSHWTIVGLDTGYHSVKWAGLEGLAKVINIVPILKDTRWAQSLKTKLPDETLKWLQTILADDSRAIIMLSHHQDLTTLDKRGSHPKPREQISRLLDRHRRILWLCGHGHRLEIHAESTDGRHAPNATVLSRTVGHGAETDVIPDAEADAKIKGSLLQFTDNRPGGYPGFGTLRFTSEHLTITYYAIEPANDGSRKRINVFSEEFTSAGGNVTGPSNVRHDPRDGFKGTLVRSGSVEV